MDLSRAKEYIVNRLVRELPKNLVYHGAHHTFDVVKSAQKIGKAEGITNDEMFLLLTAAYYHDAGFLFTYHKNEPFAVDLVKEVLPEFGYSDEEIKLIGNIILTTGVSISPKTLLEKIMCDADCDYFGREDYTKIATNFRNELTEYNVIYSDPEWIEMQIDFLENKHKYHTETSKRERVPAKKEIIKNLKIEAQRKSS